MHSGIIGSFGRVSLIYAIHVMSCKLMDQRFAVSVGTITRINVEGQVKIPIW